MITMLPAGLDGGKGRRWSQIIAENEKPVIRWQRDGEVRIAI